MGCQNVRAVCSCTEKYNAVDNKCEACDKGMVRSADGANCEKPACTKDPRFKN